MVDEERKGAEVCPFHGYMEEARVERWSEQKNINKVLFDTCSTLSKDINDLKVRMGYIGGAVMVMQFLSPIIWHLLFRGGNP